MGAFWADRERRIAGSRSKIAWAAGWCVAALCVAAPVGAQDAPKPDPKAKPATVKAAPGAKYQSLPLPNVSKEAIRAAMGAINNNDAAAVDVIDPVLDYKLAQLSQPSDLPGLATTREELKFKFLMKTLSGKLHDHLVQRTFETCKQLVGKEFHPYTRVNAALLIGELNKVEPQSKEGGIPPELYHDALPTLLDLVESGDSVEGVKVAALAGIDRHARYSSDGKTDEKVVDRARTLLTKLAKDGAGNPYVRRQAVRALGHFGLVGLKDNPAPVLATLTGVLQDAQADLSVRAEAARAIGVLDLRKATVSDPEAIAAALAALAVDAGRKTGGEGPKWAAARYNELQRVIAYVEIGFNGRNPNAGHKVELDGYLVEGEGLAKGGVAKAKPEQKTAVEGYAQSVTAFANVIFPNNNKQPADADIAAALDVLTQSVGGAAAGVAAAGTTAPESVAR